MVWNNTAGWGCCPPCCGVIIDWLIHSIILYMKTGLSLSDSIKTSCLPKTTECVTDPRWIQSDRQLSLIHANPARDGLSKQVVMVTTDPLGRKAWLCYHKWSALYWYTGPFCILSSVLLTSFVALGIKPLNSKRHKSKRKRVKPCKTVFTRRWMLMHRCTIPFPYAYHHQSEKLSCFSLNPRDETHYFVRWSLLLCLRCRFVFSVSFCGMKSSIMHLVLFLISSQVVERQGTNLSEWYVLGCWEPATLLLMFLSTAVSR